MQKIIEAITQMAGSKKAIATLTGIVVAVAGRYGLDLPADAVTQILSPIIAYVIGQGIADIGKHVPK